MTPGAILTLGLGAFSDVNHLVTLGYGTGATPPAPVSSDVIRNWRVRRRPSEEEGLSDEEIRELIRQRQIATGVIPPDLPEWRKVPPQEVAQVAEEIAQAVEEVLVREDIPIDQKAIYRASYLEAEVAIVEYRKLKRRRRAALALLLH